MGESVDSRIVFTSSKIFYPSSRSSNTEYYLSDTSLSSPLILSINYGYIKYDKESSRSSVISSSYSSSTGIGYSLITESLNSSADI